MAEKKQGTTNRPQAIPAVLYTRMFQEHPDGMKILEELAWHFYDQPCPLDPHGALYQGGQRSVFQFILSRCAEGQQ